MRILKHACVKAYLLAQQDPRERLLVQRIKAMFFLASPHRGADSAKLLSSVLKASLLLNNGFDFSIEHFHKFEAAACTGKVFQGIQR